MEVIIIMKQFQYVQDTIVLLSGASVSRNNHPGEQFEMDEQEVPRRARKKTLIALLSQILLAFGLVRH